jgi:hypothetical protein
VGAASSRETNPVEILARILFFALTLPSEFLYAKHGLFYRFERQLKGKLCQQAGKITGGRRPDAGCEEKRSGGRQAALRRAGQHGLCAAGLFKENRRGF